MTCGAGPPSRPVAIGRTSWTLACVCRPMPATSDIFTQTRFDPPAVGMTLSAIALDAAWSARKAHAGAALQGVVNCECEFGVRACCVRSRPVVHCLNDNPRLAGYP
jgi:hypothetical protein